MLVIRASQLERLAEIRRERVAMAMCQVLRELFPDRLAPLSESELMAHVAHGLRRAASYGLHLECDCARFLNLAAVLGWDFDTRPENAWMRAMLVDPDVSDPSQRLARLVGEVIYQAECDEHDARLRAGWDVSRHAAPAPLVLATKH
jgi:hypothetical protein